MQGSQGSNHNVQEDVNVPHLVPLNTASFRTASGWVSPMQISDAEGTVITQAGNKAHDAATHGKLF